METWTLFYGQKQFNPILYFVQYQEVFRVDMHGHAEDTIDIFGSIVTYMRHYLLEHELNNQLYFNILCDSSQYKLESWFDLQTLDL